jgi:6,7-dimethyl-8-ribityllumazine synthase
MQRGEYRKEREKGDGSTFRVAVVVSRFNEDITERMLEGALATLRAWRVPGRSIEIVRVPGSFEIPFACRLLLARKKKPNVIVALGCIIKGETEHDRYIASAVSQGITSLIVEYGVPISFGVITTNNLKQAVARSTGTANKGIESAQAGLEMALLARKIRA